MKNVHSHVRSFHVSVSQQRHKAPHRATIESANQFAQDSSGTLLDAIRSEVVDHRVGRGSSEAHIVTQALIRYTSKLVSIDRTQADLSNTRYALIKDTTDLASCAEMAAQQWRIAAHMQRRCDKLEAELAAHQQCTALSPSDYLVAADVTAVLDATKKRCSLIKQTLSALQQDKHVLTQLVKDHNTCIAKHLHREMVLMTEELHTLARCPELCVLVNYRAAQKGHGL